MLGAPKPYRAATRRVAFKHTHRTLGESSFAPRADRTAVGIPGLWHRVAGRLEFHEAQ